MSDSENILVRWSRRKRGLEAEAADNTPGKDSSVGLAAETQEYAMPSETLVSQEFANLPRVESITTGSAVGAFLKPDVPAELARIALRRAWTSEPAIRDFIGLSENSWDFNDPTSAYGFGALNVEEVADLLCQALGEQDELSPLSAGLPQPPDETFKQVNMRAPATEVAQTATDQAEHSRDSQDEIAQGQQASVSTDPEAFKPPSRRHGSALPE